MIKVSVIVPVYNTERYLRRCLDALVNQTLDEIEIIVINDGSTDNSASIIERYIKKYPKKIKMYTKENGGQATARNLGISKSNGIYIGFADSDDVVDIHMFQRMYEEATKKRCDLVECNYHYISEENKTTKEYKTRGNIRAYKSQKDMFIDPQVSPWNKLYRRDILMQNGVNFPEGLIYEDTSFYLKTIPYIKRESYIPERFVSYFIRGNSTMNGNKNQKVADIFEVLNNSIEFYKSNGWFEQYEQELEYFCVKIVLCSSLSRIGRVTDPIIEKELYNRSFSFIHSNFPQYKRNKYFKGKIGLYIRMVTPKNCKYIGRLLGKVMKG